MEVSVEWGQPLDLLQNTERYEHILKDLCWPKHFEIQKH